jgi:hypothetical protein
MAGSVIVVFAPPFQDLQQRAAAEVVGFIQRAELPQHGLAFSQTAQAQL